MLLGGLLAHTISNIGILASGVSAPHRDTVEQTQTAMNIPPIKEDEEEEEEEEKEEVEYISVTVRC